LVTIKDGKFLDQLINFRFRTRTQIHGFSYHTKKMKMSILNLMMMMYPYGTCDLGTSGSLSQGLRTTKYISFHGADNKKVKLAICHYSCV